MTVPVAPLLLRLLSLQAALPRGPSVRALGFGANLFMSISGNAAGPINLYPGPGWGCRFEFLRFQWVVNLSAKPFQRGMT
jgi:hypothetical protein